MTSREAWFIATVQRVDIDEAFIVLAISRDAVRILESRGVGRARPMISRIGGYGDGE